MSATEKLKALERVIPKHDGDQRSQIVLQALPQIVAVVEAAENVTFYGQEAHRYNEWHGSQIVLALVALDAALTADGKE